MISDEQAAREFRLKEGDRQFYDHIQKNNAGKFDLDDRMDAEHMRGFLWGLDFGFLAGCVHKEKQLAKGAPSFEEWCKNYFALDDDEPFNEYALANEMTDVEVGEAWNACAAHYEAEKYALGAEVVAQRERIEALEMLLVEIRRALFHISRAELLYPQERAKGLVESIDRELSERGKG